MMKIKYVCKTTAFLIVSFLMMAYFAGCTVAKKPAVNTQTRVKAGDHESVYDVVDVGLSDDAVYKQLSSFTEKSGLPKFKDFSELLNIIKKNHSNAMIINETSQNKSAPMATSGANASRGTGSSGSSDYSTTNTQVEGIDEGDIVKTDGEYLYVMTSGGIKIVKADPSDLRLMSEIKFSHENAESIKKQEAYTDEYPLGIYITDGKLVVLISKNNTGRVPYTTSVRNSASSVSEVVNYYMSTVSSYTMLRVYDLSDISAPKLCRSYEQEGSYISSREYNGKFYIVSNKRVTNYLPEDVKSETDEAEKVLPHYKNSADSEYKEIPADQISYVPDSNDSGMLLTGVVDIDSGDSFVPSVVLGGGYTVYMSQDNLYVSGTRYIKRSDANSGATSSDSVSKAVSNMDFDVVTQIFRFKLTDSGVRFSAAGTVPGSIINNLAMDEYNGVLRTAANVRTGTSRTDTTNSVYVLSPELKIIGKLDGIGNGERIQSVRFTNNTGYVVTYLNTDPLFVIDFSNPAAPSLKGELKIPGFSTYLHPLDDKTLIGLGQDSEVRYETDSSGKTIMTGSTITGMKLSVFDVSDPYKPAELFSQKLSASYSYSEALYNYHAVMVDKAKGNFGFIINSFVNKESVMSAKIYNITRENGIKELSDINLADSSSASGTAKQAYGYYPASDYMGGSRISYVGSTLFITNSGFVRAYDYNNFNKLGELKIAE